MNYGTYLHATARLYSNNKILLHWPSADMREFFSQDIKIKIKKERGAQQRRN